ncbi:MAG TPA: hypothetical protein EYQ35_03730 [candidate division UBP10 bacterium]|nr:hypothetical protein [Candidatus Binatota bacterium]
MAKKSKAAKMSPADERNRALLDRLKEVAESVGLEVREEKLHRDAGYSVQSGLCTVDGKEVLLLDRKVPVAERLELLAIALKDSDLVGQYLDPELRELIDGPGGSAGSPA